MRHFPLLFAAVALGVEVLGTSESRAQLLPEPEKRPEVVSKIVGFPGRKVEAVSPRPKKRFRMCATRGGVCTHGDEPAVVAFVNDQVNDVAQLLTLTSLPPPPADGPAGGDSRFDIYLGEGPSVVHREALDLLLPYDGVPSFAELSPPSSRCLLRQKLAKLLAEASLLGLDVAEGETSVAGFSSHLASRVAPCEAEPQAILRQEAALSSSPAAMASLARFLDEDRGAGFGLIAPALFSLSAQRRGVVVPYVADAESDGEELGPAHFGNTPSLFDVLATSMRDQNSSLRSLLLDKAVRSIGTLNDAQIAFVAKASTLPRRFALRVGVEATGSTFVRIDLDTRPHHETLEFDLSWDQGGRFGFRALKLGKDGVILGVVPAVLLERERSQTIEVRHLEGAATVMLVGVNEGDARYPFHPEAPRALPTAYEVAVYNAP